MARRAVLGIWVLCLLLAAPAAFADVASGMQWLDGREIATGVHRPSDLATASDTNTEAWITALRTSRVGDFPLLTERVRTERDETLASLARQALLRVEQGLSAATQLSEILALQQEDGGFPARAGFQSEPLTTAWMLLALDRAGQGAGTPVARALGYLQSVQQSDGGFQSVAGNLSSVYASAHVARVLASFRNRFDLVLPINRLTTFLLSARRADHTFGETFETGLAIEALLVLGVARNTLAASVAALSVEQGATGSFANDAFVTAIAIRALWAYEQPDVSPTASGITGRVLAAETELPIAGAQLSLTGASIATLTANSIGRLQSTTLPAGNYSGTLSFPGMRDINFAITLMAERTLDLGDLRMIRGTGPTSEYAIIRGVVTDSSTGLPIAGAALALATPPTQVVTDADGRYQFLQVAVGPVQLSATADGYSSRTVEMTAAPNTLIELSISLAATTTPGSGATIRGLVRHGDTGAPLGGAAIVVTAGAPPAGATTTALGVYEFNVTASPLATVTAALDGFDPVVIQVPLYDNQILEFSPGLYPTGTTPGGANRARISGIVVNQGNRQPIERALVIGIDPSGQRTALTDSQGHFALDGLNGPIVQLSFSADAHRPATVLVPLLPLEQRDIGHIGLRPTTIDVYFPDLVITDSSLATTEPDSYQLAQSFTVEIANRGTSAVSQDFTLIAFVDGNGNGMFDAAVEPEAGRTRVDRDLPIGNSSPVSIAVAAQLAYRDAPIAFWVDGENEIPEQSETNNVGSSLLGCRIEQTPIGPGTLHEAWHWSGLASNPQVNSLTQTPSVTQLTDDNGDGVINAYDTPDLVFVAGLRNTNTPGITALVAISGEDGQEHWARTDLSLSPFSSVATGDIDNDGIAEIVAVMGYRQELIAFEHTGAIKWRAPLNGPGSIIPIVPPPDFVFDQPIIVNLEGDNEAEIVLGREAFRGLTGEQLWEGEFDAGGNAGRPVGGLLAIADGQAAIAADVDLDGTMEVIAGRTMYDFEGHTRWHRGDIKPEPHTDAVNQRYNDSGYAAVGNFDLDDQAEIVLAIDDELYLLDHELGQTIWGPKFAPDFSAFGAPAIADIDADGLPEIVVSSQGQLTVFESDGTIKRTTEIADPSGFTTPTVFDFQNDGSYEVVHLDARYLRIFDALTLQPLDQAYNTSHTVYEVPVVADVDGDKQADIVIVGNDDDFVPSVTPGIRVFKAVDGAFADAGSVWGSHAFHVDDVAEDSIIPLLETPSWLTHNTYRVQRSPTPDPLGMPDFAVGGMRVLDNGPGLDPSVTVRVGNAGPVDAHEPVWIGLYHGDPAAGGTLLRQIRLDTLRPSRFQNIDFGTVPFSGNGALYAVADHAARAGECREQNNQRSIDFAATQGLGDLQLGTDKPVYRPGETAVFRATVANQGALPAGFRVGWSVRDGIGRTTASFSDAEFVPINAGSSADRMQNWATSGVLAASYVLTGRLYNAEGQQIDTASASFAIQGDINGPAGGIALTFGRSSYAPGEPATLTFRARNLSSSEIIRRPEVTLSVVGPGGFSLQRNLPYDDLFAGAFVDGASAMDGTGAPGIYTVTGRLRSRLTGAEYAVDLASFERLADGTASIQGFVDAMVPILMAGETQTCLYTARNLGAIPLLEVPLRRTVVHLDTGSVRLQQTVNPDLAPGSDYVASDSIVTGGYATGDYACLLEISNGSTWRVLDSEPFTLAGAPGPDIEVSPTFGLVTTEAGGSGEFSVRLTAAPTANVVIPLSVSDASEFRLPTTTLTFTPANWSVARLVDVVGVDDSLVDGDIIGNIIVGPAASDDSNYDGRDPADVGVINFDDDPIRVSVSPTLVDTSENGTSATFQVSINAAPSASVAIPLQSGDSSEWTISPSTLIFDAANWQSAQSVTVTGVDDSELDGLVIGNIATLAAQSADVRFNALDPVDVVARNADNDGAAILVEPTALITTEGGSAASFTLRLNAAPTGDVIVPIGPVDTSEWQVLDLEIVLNAGNWQSGRTITVTPVNDAIVDGDQVATLLLGVAQSTDARFNGVNPADVSLTNRDNDGPQILVSPTTGLIVNEAGSSDTFTVSMTVEPTAPVSIALTIGDLTEFALAIQSVTFAPGDFAPRIVTVTGVDDVLVDGNIVGSIQLAAAVSDDARYQGINPPDVVATNIDDEVVQIIVTPFGSIETDEGGTSATVEVRLSAEPTADVQIAIANPDTSEWTFDRSEFQFTMANWAAPQVLTVTGVNDFEIDGDVLGVVGLAPVVSGDARYNGLNPPDVPAVNRDNDRAAAILVSPEGALETTEAGASATFEVRLSTEPTADVRIALSNPDTSEIELDRSEVVFTTAAWTTPQIVRVTGVDDTLLDGDINATIGLAPAVSTDSRYLGVDPRDVPVVNRNDDFIEPAELIVTDVDLSVSEAGDAGRIEIALNRAPAVATPVRLLITSADTGEVLATPLLVFNATNATIPQAIVLTGVDEFIDDGDQTVSVTIAVSADSDPDFAALPPITRVVVNIDNDTAGIELRLTGPSRILESQSTTLALSLTSKPIAAVSVTLEAVLRAPGQFGDLLFALVPLTATIPPEQWTMPVALQLQTTDNGLANLDQIVDVRVVSVTSDDPGYHGQTAAPLAIEVTDRGAYGLQAIPVNRGLGWLAMVLLMSGIWVVAMRERGGR